MKAAKRYVHENYINGFSKKILLWAKCTILGAKMTGLYLCICYKEFSMLDNKRDQEVHENYVIDFSKKMSCEAKCQFWIQNDISS